MIKLIVALIIWFPFTVPKDTTPKIKYIDTYKVEAVYGGPGEAVKKITKDKSIVDSVKVTIIIPPRNKVAVQGTITRGLD